jgi:uncharacterized protein YjdB
MNIAKRYSVLTLLLSILVGGTITQSIYHSSQFRANAETLVTRTLDTTVFTSAIFGINAYGGTASSRPERTATLNDVTYGGKAITTSATNSPNTGLASRFIQAQASNGIIYNTTSLPGRIKTIETVQVGTPAAHTLFLGNVRLVSSASHDFNTAGTSQGEKTDATSTWNAPLGENHYFFSIKKGTTVSYFSSISITYDTDVPPSAEVAVSSVALELASTTLNSGQTTQGTATVSPENATNKSVSWSSSSTSIATVNSSGLVTANSSGVSGPTTIRATSVADATKFAEVVLTVNPVLVTSISVSFGQASIGIGSTTTAIASVLHANATNKIFTRSEEHTSELQ